MAYLREDDFNGSAQVTAKARLTSSFCEEPLYQHACQR
jgi:hypothetical protein